MSETPATSSSAFSAWSRWTAWSEPSGPVGRNHDRTQDRTPDRSLGQTGARRARIVRIDRPAAEEIAGHVRIVRNAAPNGPTDRQVTIAVFDAMDVADEIVSVVVVAAAVAVAVEVEVRR